MTPTPIQEYPVHGLMPKQDTQAASFIKKYPQYDGRGTVIAILDTGVDPGAAGMQVTTDGKPKIIDIVDCTGGGDVDTSKKVKPTVEDGVSTIQGLSGRKLILDNSWNNPSGEYRVGVKRAYELFPTELKNRVKSERRQNFVKKQAQLLSEAQYRLADYNKKTEKVDEAEKTELEARIEALKELDKNYEDPGPILDCVVFFDGKDWRAVIDLNESGDLRGQPCLTDYRKELQYHTFGKADLLNFSVNIYSNGDVLSIVTLSGSHGTHVAGITAANFPDEPALNGVAPGAQLLSLRIGDARLGSMETGPGLTRAAAHLAMHKVDLANMSYGESSGLPTDGHFIQLLANEAIGKSGCIFVTSAGNDGPCYSSIGAPAGMDESFITVGAYVKHAQMQAEYALLESVSERPFTWSSRGPTTDGYHGVDIYAPGSAITSIPVYVLNKLDLKNGTSMSSPNACGCVALLVSALKAEKLEYTPYRLKNAIRQTAKSVNDPLNVDPTSLASNKIHYGEVLGYDTAAPDRGPLFRVPVTVIKPLVPKNGSIEFKNTEFEPGYIDRNYIHVPEGATNVELVIKSRAPVETSPARFMLHLLQLVPKQNQKGKHAFSILLGDGSFGNPASEEQTISRRLSVRPNLTLELCLAQFWSALGKHTVDISLNFHGVQIAGNLANGQGTIRLEPQLTRLEICSPLRKEVGVNPSVSFDKLRKYIRPAEATITPMDAERDLLPTGRVLYQLVLRYNFTVDSSTSVIPRFPPVMNQLYEHFLAGVFGIVYDANCKIVGYLDVFDHKIKLEQKGEYTIMLQLSTEEENVLEKLKGTVCELDLDLKTVNFNTYTNIADVYKKDSSTATKTNLERKDLTVLYIAAPTGQDALPKEVKPGDALVGKLDFVSKVEGGQYTAIYTVPPSPAESKSDKEKNEKPTEEEIEQQLKDATRDLEISYLKKFEADSAAYKALLSKIESQYVDDIAFLEFKLSRLWSTSGNSEVESLITPGKLSSSEAKEIIQITDAILSKINERELSEFYGLKEPENETDEQKKKRKQNDQKKKQLVNALKHKAMAYAATLDDEANVEPFKATVMALQQWTSDDSSSNLTSLLLKVKQERKAGHPGNALKAIQKYLSEASFTSSSVKDISKVWKVRNELYKELGWNLWSEYDDKWSVIRQPPYGYALF
ncbi:hypothetical protein RMCBS344292_17722 [Rhizopus microsporus]|nr:hypothetical protein RMCBS344292_17722 [Rhizopus microsporus]